MPLPFRLLTFCIIRCPWHGCRLSPDDSLALLLRLLLLLLGLVLNLFNLLVAILRFLGCLHELLLLLRMAFVPLVLLLPIFLQLL
jgi:hypothetical protein